MKRISVVLIALAMVACQKEDETPSTRLIQYGPHERNIMDFRYTGPTCFLFIHGGGWVLGDKSTFDYMDRTVTGYGFSFATMNYRFVNDSIHWQEEQEDVAAAIHALKLNGIRQVILVGQSAGSNISMLYASRNSVSLVVGIGNVVRADTLVSPEVKQLGKVYAPEPEEVNIIHHLPRCYTILIHGDRDDATFPQQATMLKEKMGSNCRLLMVEGRGHYIEESLLSKYFAQICQEYPRLPHGGDGGALK